MLDTKPNSSVDIGSNKNFGYFFSIILVILCIIFFNHKYSYIVIIFTIFFFTITFTSPKLLKYPNLIWFKFGLLLGKIISPILLFLIYVFLIIPMGLLLNIFKINLLKKKPDTNVISYWKIKNYNSNTKRQF